MNKRLKRHSDRLNWARAQCGRPTGGLNLRAQEQIVEAIEKTRLGKTLYFSPARIVSNGTALKTDPPV